MSIEERPTAHENFRPSITPEKENAPLVSLDERIRNLKDDRQMKAQARKAQADLHADGFLHCGADNPFERAAEANGKPKWRELGSVEAGKGKSFGIDLSLDGGSARHYRIPLDDIGRKKGVIKTNGSLVEFEQTDGWPWESTYRLQWKSDEDAPGGIRFAWK